MKRLAFILLVLFACNEFDDGPFVTGDLPIEQLSETFALPILSYRLGVQDLLDPVDYDFSNKPDTGLVVLSYASDTILQIISQEVQMVNPSAALINVDLTEQLLPFGSVTLSRNNFFGDVVLSEINLDSPSTPDEISLPNETFLPGVSTPTISFDIDNRLSDFELTNGILRIRGSNDFACDVSFTYHLINNNDTIDFKNVSVIKGDVFEENHVVDFVGLSAIAFQDLEVRVSNFTFSNGTISNSGDIRIDMEINQNWIGRMTFGENLTFGLDTISRFPVEIRNSANSTVSEFRSTNGLLSYLPSTSPVSTPNLINFQLANSTAPPLATSMNSPFESRISFQEVVYSSGDGVSINSINVIGVLSVAASERLTFDSGNPSFTGILEIKGLDSPIISFEGELDRSLSLPTISDDISVSIFRNTFLVNSSINLSAINLDLKATNSFGVPYKLDLIELALINNGSVLERLNDLPVNTLPVRADNSDSLNIELGSLIPIFQQQPDRISFTFQPGLAVSDSSDDFLITDTTSLEFKFNVPLSIDVSGIQYYDSVSLSLDWEDQLDLFENMKLEIGFKNQFPLDFRGQLYIINDFVQSRTPLLEDGIFFPSSPNETMTIRRDLPEELMKELISSESLVFELTYESNESEVGNTMIRGEDELLFNCKIVQPAPKD